MRVDSFKQDHETCFVYRKPILLNATAKKENATRAPANQFHVQYKKQAKKR